MKKIIIFQLVLAVAITSFGKSYNIKGSVIGVNEEDLYGYNIVLLHPEDSSFYKGDFYMERNFSIETSVLPIILKVTSMGFIDQMILVDDTIEVLDIKLATATTTLSEVVVKASTPLFSAKTDRLTMNVESTVLSQAGTAVDVLQKAARVKVDNSGGVSVLGVGNALIVVDGRLLPSNQVLESIPSSDIQKIDIITNPSAKYDASGKAVIEISTKKAKDNGWGGEFTSRIAKGKNWRKYIGTEISGKINDLSVFASYALVPEKRTWNEEYERIYPQEIKILNTIETHTKVVNNHNFRLATDYNLSNEHTVGAQFSGSIRNTEKDILNFNKLINDQVVSDILSDQDGQLYRKYFSGTAFYSFSPKSEKIKLDVLFDKSNFSTDEKVNIKENNLSKYNDIRTDININSIKTDFQLHLTNIARLDLGGKFSQIRNNSTTGFYIDNEQNNFLNYN